MLTQTVPLTKTGRLILVRLLAPSKRMNASALRKGLEPFYRGRSPGEWKALFDETLAALERDGLITREPLAPTDAGRAQALEFLGLEKLPPGTDWKKLKNNYLVPATFAGPADESRRARLRDGDGLKIAVLRLRYDLPEVKTLSQALDALICKELDLEPSGALTLGVMKARILGRLLGLVGNPPLKDVRKLVPGHAIGANRSGVDDLRAALLREWLREEAPARRPAAGERPGGEEGSPEGPAEAPAEVAAEPTAHAGTATPPA
jgi:hypothetical protein